MHKMLRRSDGRRMIELQHTQQLHNEIQIYSNKEQQALEQTPKYCIVLTTIKRLSIWCTFLDVKLPLLEQFVLTLFQLFSRACAVESRRTAFFKLIIALAICIMLAGLCSVTGSSCVGRMRNRKGLQGLHA